MAQSMTPAPALFETRRAANGARIEIITLNAERSLNALSLEMARAVTERLQTWRNSPEIACVVLQGAGEKAFCAGGDVVTMYRWLSQRDATSIDQHSEEYFTAEYTLDYLIHTYPKPILCWGHGVVMGGGLGMMVGASHRIVTETSRIAMPEITIGLYPDVGASWFLNRMPGRTGLYAGLTGAPLNAADALFAKLADYYLPGSERQGLFDRLLQIDWTSSDRGNHHKLSALLRSYRDKHPLPESRLRQHFDWINAVTDYDSVEEIAAALAVHGTDDPWIQRAVQTLQKGSPSSAKVIFGIYRRAKHLSLKQAFLMELGLTIQFCRRSDLREGVRALLIEKDNKPKWSPATLADVSERDVEQYFISPWKPEQHPFRHW
jgi:enoyl-CoA hydratase/carnithine racemase